MWLVVGLGNPGKKYQNNRHNVGFMVVDELVERHRLGPYREKFGGLTTSGTIAGQPVVVLKPMEFMNLSGFAVERATHFHHIETSQIVVIHDEIDLPFETLRLKSGGGHGGHNGLRSISEKLGKNDYLRVRIGVSKPQKADGSPGHGEVSNHVLGDFPAAQQAQAKQLVKQAADAVDTILAQGMSRAMNQWNGAGPKQP